MLPVAAALSPDPDASLSPTRTTFCSSLAAFPSDLPSRGFPNQRQIEDAQEDYTPSTNLPKKIDSILGTNLPQCPYCRRRRRAREPPAGSSPETAYGASSFYEKAAFRRTGSWTRAGKEKGRRIRRVGRRTWCWIRRCRRRRRWRPASCDGTLGRGCPRRPSRRGGWTPRPTRPARRRTGTAGWAGRRRPWAPPPQGDAARIWGCRPHLWTPSLAPSLDARCGRWGWGGKKKQRSARGLGVSKWERMPAACCTLLTRPVSVCFNPYLT